MFGLPLAFASPLILGALIALPVLWYLLKLTPPKPRSEVFPPFAILQNLIRSQETPSKSPWWLTLLRLSLATFIIVAMAGPIWRPQEPTTNKTNNIILIVDDGWASGGISGGISGQKRDSIWESIKNRANLILGQAQENNNLVTLIRTTNPMATGTDNLPALQVKELLAATTNIAVKPDLKKTAGILRKQLSKNPNNQIIYLSDGLAHDEDKSFSQTLANSAVSPIIYLPAQNTLSAITHISNEPEKMVGTIIRADVSNNEEYNIIGYDKKGLPIAQHQTSMGKNTSKATFEFVAPIELRNQIVRVQIKNQRHGGAVQLLDDSNRRRIVGLISSHGSDISQPLLSPLYYINHALTPFSDTRHSQTANVENAITNLFQQNISAMFFSDVGNLTDEITNKITTWIEKGGMLIRFAGPRLAANPDAALLPIELVKGDRLIGGALSWEKPKRLAPFENDSPFYGLKTNQEITINRQVMASQEFDISKNTWSRLEDGTPLVTASKMGQGWVVLFHVNSDNNWSNLPLSGTFVEMLRRLINLSHSTATSNNPFNSEQQIRLPALKILNGKGELTSPTANIKPLPLSQNKTPSVGLENPPGQYGTIDGYVALNLLSKKDTLKKIDPKNYKTASIKTYTKLASIKLAPLLIAMAVALFIIDTLAQLWFAGALNKHKFSFNFSKVKSLLVIALISFSTVLITPTNPTAQTIENQAQKNIGKDTENEIEIDFSATLSARLAYVVSGISEMDKISQAGLSGLSQFIASRTALVPSEPHGVNIETDELSFYPILYWPIHADSNVPSQKTMARVDAYMKQGGSVLFDTRDQLSGILRHGNSPQNLKLRQILASLDIPTLEPVPKTHVLRKSFYLLDTFPGRYEGGNLWVERIGSADEYQERKAKTADGVSSILITSNDFAGAWAVDVNGRPMFATIPAGSNQRHYAYRVGVNILMYMMTGNYKADQVHIPALLERLGQ